MATMTQEQVTRLHELIAENAPDSAGYLLAEQMGTTILALDAKLAPLRTEIDTLTAQIVQLKKANRQKAKKAKTGKHTKAVVVAELKAVSEPATPVTAPVVEIPAPVQQTEQTSEGSPS